MRRMTSTDIASRRSVRSMKLTANCISVWKLTKFAIGVKKNPGLRYRPRVLFLKATRLLSGVMQAGSDSVDGGSERIVEVVRVATGALASKQFDLNQAH